MHDLLGVAARSRTLGHRLCRPVGTLLLAAALGGLLATSGCDGSAVIWSTRAPSPDGRFLASASTIENAGPGTADVETGVYVQDTAGGSRRFMVLLLANDSMWPRGITEVALRWPDPQHLSIDYQGHASIELQVIKWGGLDIQTNCCSLAKDSDVVWRKPAAK